MIKSPVGSIINFCKRYFPTEIQRQINTLYLCSTIVIERTINMTGDIHSVDFYKKIALSKADINANGNIDNDTEQSIFNQEISEFDMNKDGQLDEKDIPLFKESITFTYKEKEAIERKAKFDNEHPDFNPETATDEEIEEYMEVISNYPSNKINSAIKFNAKVASATGYMLDTGDKEAFDEYFDSIKDQIDNPFKTAEPEEAETTENTQNPVGEVIEETEIPEPETLPTEEETKPEEPVVQAPVEDKSEPEVKPQTQEPIPETVQVNNTPQVVQTEQPTAPPTQPVTDITTGQSQRTHSPVYRTEQSPRLKTLEQMSLDELKSEKEKRETTLKEKQSNLSEVNNNKTPKIAEAKQQRNIVLKEYEKALKDDPVAKFFAKNIMKLEKSIEKNLEDIDKNSNDTTEKENEISSKTEELSLSKSTLSGLERALASLPAISGKEEDKEKDAKILAKQKSINKQIEKQKNTIEKQEKSLEKLKKDLDDLKIQKTKLEEEKQKLAEEKEKTEEIIQKLSKEDTQAKMKAYNDAVKNFAEVKAQELQAAQKEVQTATQSVQEVNEKINKAVEKVTFNKNSLIKEPDIKEIDPAAVNEYNVREVTMPNGLKVLACDFSLFDKAQPEWLDQQQYLLKAADELGLTILYSDVTRTVAASNAGRAKKGSLVLAGGQSPHNYGVATDLVLYKDGKAVGVNSELQTEFAHKAVEYSGGKIEWGGEWDKKGERHHFQLRNWKDTYKSPEYLVG